jgi:hypothetical protein
MLTSFILVASTLIRFFLVIAGFILDQAGTALLAVMWKTQLFHTTGSMSWVEAMHACIVMNLHKNMSTTQILN